MSIPGDGGSATPPWASFVVFELEIEDISDIVFDSESTMLLLSWGMMDPT